MIELFDDQKNIGLLMAYILYCQQENTSLNKNISAIISDVKKYSIQESFNDTFLNIQKEISSHTKIINDAIHNIISCSKFHNAEEYINQKNAILSSLFSFNTELNMQREFLNQALRKIISELEEQNTQNETDDHVLLINFLANFLHIVPQDIAKYKNDNFQNFIPLLSFKRHFIKLNADISFQQKHIGHYLFSFLFETIENESTEIAKQIIHNMIDIIGPNDETLDLRQNNNIFSLALLWDLKNFFEHNNNELLNNFTQECNLLTIIHTFYPDETQIPFEFLQNVILIQDDVDAHIAKYKIMITNNIHKTFGMNNIPTFNKQTPYFSDHKLATYPRSTQAITFDETSLQNLFQPPSQQNPSHNALIHLKQMQQNIVKQFTIFKNLSNLATTPITEMQHPKAHDTGGVTRTFFGSLAQVFSSNSPNAAFSGKGDVFEKMPLLKPSLSLTPPLTRIDKSRIEPVYKFWGRTIFTSIVQQRQSSSFAYKLFYLPFHQKIDPSSIPWPLIFNAAIRHCPQYLIYETTSLMEELKKGTIPPSTLFEDFKQRYYPQDYHEILNIISNDFWIDLTQIPTGSEFNKTPVSIAEVFIDDINNFINVMNEYLNQTQQDNRNNILKFFNRIINPNNYQGLINKNENAILEFKRRTISWLTPTDLEIYFTPQLSWDTLNQKISINTDEPQTKISEEQAHIQTLFRNALRSFLMHSENNRFLFSHAITGYINPLDFIKIQLTRNPKIVLPKITTCNNLWIIPFSILQIYVQPNTPDEINIEIIKNELITPTLQEASHLLFNDM